MKSLMERKKKRVFGQDGIALASVLIVLTLVILMASTLLRVSYVSFSRKMVERRTVQNFYLTEDAVDLVKLYAQSLAAPVLDKAKESTAEFVDAAYTELNSGMTEDKIMDVLLANGFDVAGLKPYDPSDPVDGGRGGSLSVGTVIKGSKTITIKDLTVHYVHTNGYESEIKTDIVINAPQYAAAVSNPVGTYSMFAGKGSSIAASGAHAIQASNNKIQWHYCYYHQEGNVYFGMMSAADAAAAGENAGTAFVLQSGDPRTSSTNVASFLYSIGGDNCIFNGNLVIQAGNSLVFSGGEGKNTVLIDVRGYIVLEQGATLFLPPNFILNCKGIKVRGTDTPRSADVESLPDYTGVNGVSTYLASQSLTGISQYYPFAQDYVNGKMDTTTLGNFRDNKYDVTSVLIEKNINFTGDLENYTDGTKADLLYGQVIEHMYDHNGAQEDSKGFEGVFVLDAAIDTSVGFQNANREKFRYKLSTLNETGFHINPTDPELDPVNAEHSDIMYNGKAYDPQFFEFVNVPTLEMFSAMSTFTAETATVAKDYSVFDTSTYTQVVFDEEHLRTDNSLFDSDDYWEAGQVKTEPAGAFGTRSFAIPQAHQDIVDAAAAGSGGGQYQNCWSFGLVNKGESYLNSFNFQTYFSDNTTDVKYVPSLGTSGFGTSGNGTINVNAGSRTSAGLSILVCNDNVTVHISNGYVCGMFMSAGKVNFGEDNSTRTIRAISLFDMADKMANPGLALPSGAPNIDNELEQYLELVGTLCYHNKGQYLPMICANNVFNGGMSAFWSNTNGGGGGGLVNASGSQIDFVTAMNWTKQ